VILELFPEEKMVCRKSNCLNGLLFNAAYTTVGAYAEDIYHVDRKLDKSITARPSGYSNIHENHKEMV